MTALNREILELIRNSDCHMNAEEVFLKAKQNNISVSLASVYRILAKLSDEGMIRRMTIPGGPDFYDKAFVPHGHAICPVCGKIEDFRPEGLEEILNEAIGEFVSYELSVSRLCSDCREKKL